MATMSMRVAAAAAAAAAVSSPAKSSTVHRLGSRQMVGEFRGARGLGMAAVIAPGARMLWRSEEQRKVLKAVNGVRAMASANGVPAPSGLPIDLRGKRAFIAGVADDQGFGWAIAKALAAAGAEILVGTWVPALNIFETSLRRGKFDESRQLPTGGLLEIAKVYPLDAVFDTPEDVPEDIKNNKRYAGSTAWTVQVTKPLMETSRKGYLAAVSASTYSYVSLLKYFAPIMNPGGSALSLTYLASEKIIPGYGGGMSSAKAALESDTRVLAFEAGRKYGIRVNTISAGPLKSRAAKAIGFIDDMINYSSANAPLQKELEADDVGHAAAFLSSPLASAVTGTLLYVDNGLHAMGLAVDSPCVAKAATPATL
uniref:Uncharacterized protein n=1 Tax=Physcomitrium patens TaxID=3218 RepID=A0A7I4EH02_PHYPA